jgi:hypothetical protein
MLRLKPNRAIEALDSIKAKEAIVELFTAGSQD